MGCLKLKPLNTYEPLPWQVAPYRNKNKILLLTGSAGGGKSRLAAEKIVAYLKKYPNAQGLILRKFAESLKNSTLLFLERIIIGRDPTIVHVSSLKRFEFSNGSVLSYGGMKDESQRERIRSIGLDGGVDIVWFEEAISFIEDDFNEILGRMRGKAAPWKQIILTTNPGPPSHWIYKRMIQGGEASVYYSSATDNSHNPDDYVESLDKMTGVLRLRLRDGKWVQAEGAVYEEFDPQFHLINPFEIPKDWKRYRVVDFGYEAPFVCQWWAVDHDGAMYMYREIYHSHILYKHHADNIIKLSDGERVITTVCDHDAEGRATLDEKGIKNIPAVKAVETGLQAVRQRLTPQRWGNGKMRPRIFFFKGALVKLDRLMVEEKKPTCTVDEFPGYVLKKNKDNSEVKEEPVKKDDHGMDAVRYIVMHIDKPKKGLKFRRAA